MKRFLIPLVLLLFIFGIFAASFLWWDNNIKSPSNDSSPKSFLITKGTSAAEIGERLYKGGFVKNPLAFKIYLQVTSRSEKIQAGEYKLPSNLSLYELVDTLLAGPAEIWVTIPEGLRREEIIERFIQAFELKGVEAENFRKEFLSLTKNEEGYLFPDTYLFPKTASPSLVVGRMREIFDSRFDEEMNNAISESGYLLNQVVILASIIERETKTEEERPIVAGILLKRLNAKWPLQADATLQYGVANVKCQMSNVSSKGGSASGGKCDNWWTPLTKEDIEIKSPFNSYKTSGLPPTPIASPGLSSISAAIFPQETPYWFYLHDASGKIHYAKTLEEHNRNINTFLGNIEP